MEKNENEKIEKAVNCQKTENKVGFTDEKVFVIL